MNYPAQPVNPNTGRFIKRGTFDICLRGHDKNIVGRLGGSCNTVLGLIEENSQTLERLKEYLRRNTNVKA